MMCILHVIFAKSNTCKTLWYFSKYIVKNKSIRKGEIWFRLYNKVPLLCAPDGEKGKLLRRFRFIRYTLVVA
jgi:hypothetical protein